MNPTAGLQDAVTGKELQNNAQFKAWASEYLAKEHPIVRGLHRVLQVLTLFCAVVAAYFFFAAVYHTYIWATTRNLTSLTAWVNFGLSMSLVVFPLGLDSMLLRVFPAIIFPAAAYRSDRPLIYKTGIGAFFAGFGIMCAGSPGAVYMSGLAWQAIQRLF